MYLSCQLAPLATLANPPKTDLSTRQYRFTDEDKERFRNDPKFFLEFRQQIEAEINIMFEMYMQGSEVSKNLKELVTEEMKRRIGPNHEKLLKFIIPKWSPGCRRVSPADGYLEALTAANVEPVFGEIDHVSDRGIVVAGKEYQMDVLVCATGFQPAFKPPFKVFHLRTPKRLS
jgi:cation diffusion facilitator CzcD-associated flavoprotein CzcO